GSAARLGSPRNAPAPQDVAGESRARLLPASPLTTAAAASRDTLATSATAVESSAQLRTTDPVAGEDARATPVSAATWHRRPAQAPSQAPQTDGVPDASAPPAAQTPSS